MNLTGLRRGVAVYPRADGARRRAQAWRKRHHRVHQHDAVIGCPRI